MPTPLKLDETSFIEATRMNPHDNFHNRISCCGKLFFLRTDSIENTLPSWLITGNNRTINSTRWTRDISFYIIFVNDLIRHHSKSSHLNRYVLSIDRRDSIKLYHRFSSKNTFYIFVPSNRNPAVFSTRTRGRSNRVIGSERSHMIDSRFNG